MEDCFQERDTPGRSKGRADGAAALKKNNFMAFIWLY